MIINFYHSRDLLPQSVKRFKSEVIFEINKSIVNRQKSKYNKLHIFKTFQSLFFLIWAELLCTAVSRYARACWRLVLDWTAMTRTTTLLLCWLWKRDKTKSSNSWLIKEPASTSRICRTTWMCCTWRSRRTKTIRCCCCLRQLLNAWSIRLTRSSWRPSTMQLNTAISRSVCVNLFFWYYCSDYFLYF